MLKKMPWLVMILLAAQFLCADIIEKIQVEGNRKVSRETIQFYMKSREGGIYDPQKLKDDFQTLWETGFFENIRIEDENGAGGKIVRLVFVENPLISSVTYKTSKKVKESDITEKLQGSNILLQAFSYYSPAKIRKVKKIITDMLLEKGYNQAAVTIDEKEENGQIALTIHAEAGYKTRIADVVFPGLPAHSVSAEFPAPGPEEQPGARPPFHHRQQGRLQPGKDQRGHRGGPPAPAAEGLPGSQGRDPGIRHWSPRRPFSAGGSRCTGSASRWSSAPATGWATSPSRATRSSAAISCSAWSPSRKGRYTTSRSATSSSRTSRSSTAASVIFTPRWCPARTWTRSSRRADLTINIQENEVVYLGKLEFTGNTFTKDHVIRREWFLREGRRLNINALEDSMKRMKQLGLVTVEKMPEIKADPQDPQKINITAEVKELNRQMINFNVGYSGYEGWFIAAGLFDPELPGHGRVLHPQPAAGHPRQELPVRLHRALPVQPAGEFRHRRLQDHLPATPPCTPARARASTFPRRPASGPIGAHRWSTAWRTSPSPTSTRTTSSRIPIRVLLLAEGKRRISALMPTLYYSTVDSPIFPTSGSKILASYRYSGGFLGGDIYLHKLKLEAVQFQPLWSRHVLGLHFVYEGLAPFGGKGIPFYEKYFLGGERSVRGFDIYTLGPRDKNGTVLGGNKSFLFNLEYSIPLTQQFSFVFFYDVGNSYDVGTPIKLKDVYTSAGLELKVFVPMLNVPFRLIFAYNPRLLQTGDAHFVFKFAVGPSFY